MHNCRCQRLSLRGKRKGTCKQPRVPQCLETSLVSANMERKQAIFPLLAYHFSSDQANVLWARTDVTLLQVCSKLSRNILQLGAWQSWQKWTIMGYQLYRRRSNKSLPLQTWSFFPYIPIRCLNQGLSIQRRAGLGQQDSNVIVLQSDISAIDRGLCIRIRPRENNYSNRWENSRNVLTTECPGTTHKPLSVPKGHVIARCPASPCTDQWKSKRFMTMKLPWCSATSGSVQNLGVLGLRTLHPSARKALRLNLITKIEFWTRSPSE